MDYGLRKLLADSNQSRPDFWINSIRGHVFDSIFVELILDKINFIEINLVKIDFG